MSVKRTVKLDIDAKDVLKKLDKIEKELRDVQKSVDANTKEMNQLGKAASTTADSMGTLAGGIGVVAVALKALAISTALKAFDMFFSILRNNQTVLDATNKAFETLNIGIKTFVNDIVSITTTGVLKNFFSDIKEGTSSLKNMRSALSDVISNFNIFQSIRQNIFSAIFGNFKDRVKDAKALADQIVDLRNEVLLAEADQRLLQLTFQKDAEIQRQIRDDIRKTPEERLKANERLGKILQNQLAEEQKVADKRLELALLEKSTDEDNIQFKVNEKNALAELADLQERITSQQSEQLTNQASLEAEIAEDRKKRGEQEKVISLERLGTQQKDLENLEEIMKRRKEIAKETSDFEIKTEKLTAQSKRDIIANSLMQFGELAGEESKAGKALAISSTLINTYSAAANALAPVASGGAGPIWGIPVAAGAIASGLANVAKIRATKLPYGDDNGLDSGSQPSVPQGLSASLIPNLEGIQGTPVGEVAPVQAFVVENDISNAQALQEELDIQATL